MKILSFIDIKELIRRVGLRTFMHQLIGILEEDFLQWHAFHKTARHASHYPQGVIELMPCSDQHLYAYKYVNGHPGNTAKGKLSVVSVGQLSEVSSGYPLMISEMTLLTSIRTATTGALAAKFLARENSHRIAIIGTGAQSEFQVIGFNQLFDLKEVSFFDIDAQAKAKFYQNMAASNLELIPCHSISDAIHDADIIVTATAVKKHQVLFNVENLAPGTHIHAIGGDCPGKTELSRELLQASKIVVEYAPQTLEEGEIQQCGMDGVYAELWELVCQQKPGRVNDYEITIFDSVGFALEDFSVLRLVNKLAEQYQLGTEISFLPEPDDPKDLYGLISP